MVFGNEKGLSAADTRAYRDLVRILEAHEERISEVQHFVGNKDARRQLVSEDGEAAYLVVGLTSGIGSPESEQDVHWLREQVADLSVPPGTSTYVTGDPAIVEVARFSKATPTIGLVAKAPGVTNVLVWTSDSQVHTYRVTVK